MEAVDLALVLAIDGSASVDREEWALMLGGLAAAFRDTGVQAALPRGGLAVCLLAWSGRGSQDRAIDWTRIGDAAAMERFAEALDMTPRVLIPGATALGEALIRSLAELGRLRAAARRLVVDVAGDGRSNSGPPPRPVRDRAADAGIGINGLAVLNEEPDLLAYYAAEVIAGPGAFVIAARDYEAFAEAMREKLKREFAAEPVVA